MGKFVPAYELPNQDLLGFIVGVISPKYKGEMNTPEMRFRLKDEISRVVLGLIMTGEWVTRTMTSDRRFIKFIEVDVLTIDNMPDEVRIVPIWEYEEDIYGEDSRPSDQGYMEGSRRLISRD